MVVVLIVAGYNQAKEGSRMQASSLKWPYFRNNRTITTKQMGRSSHCYGDAAFKHIHATFSFLFQCVVLDLFDEGASD